MSVVRTGPSRCCSRRKRMRRQLRCLSMVLSGPAAVDWPSRVRRGRQERARRSAMAIVQRNVQVKASPQETMALLADASRWPDWYPGMTEINVAAPFPEEGGKVAFKVKSA